MIKWISLCVATFLTAHAGAQISHTVNLQVMSNGGYRDVSWALAASMGQQVGVYQHQIEPPPQFEYIAPLWDGTAKGRIDLRPKGSGRAEVWNVYDGNQVGFATFNDPFYHALLWNGSAQGYVDLHVDTIGGVQLNRSQALGIHGNQQVGFGAGAPFSDRALMWQGTAASAIDLHPTALGVQSSNALKTDGEQQVGFGYLPDGSTKLALLWEGSAESVINLTPKGSASAEACDVADGRQVGTARFGGVPRAYIWEGTSKSGIDVTPTWASGAGLNGTNGVWHVGWYTMAASGNDRFAAMWNAETLEFFDLHQFLPTSWQPFPPQAYGIDEVGNVVGYGSSPGINPFDKRAVMWVVPELSTFVSLGVGLLATLLIRRRTRI